MVYFPATGTFSEYQRDGSAPYSSTCRNLRVWLSVGDSLSLISLYNPDLRDFFLIVSWVFPKIGVKPPKWMVKIMVPNPMNKWMIWGVKTPYFWVDTHIELILKFS